MRPAPTVHLGVEVGGSGGSTTEEDGRQDNKGRVGCTPGNKCDRGGGR